MGNAADGVRVIDASQGVAGGYCTKLLAGLGADVIKVEPPGTGDRIRATGPFPGDVPDHETSAEHLHLSTGKRSITLDVTTRTGASLLRRLLARADVYVAPDHSVLDLDNIEREFPSLVVARITPYGAGGPRAGWRGGEIIEFAVSGYMSLNGDPDREPLKVYGEQAQYQAGIHAALGIVAALAAHDRDGAGQRVDVASAEAAGFLIAGALQRGVLMRRPQVRAGARPAGFAPNRLYPSTVRPCLDGHVHVHCHNRFPDLIAALMEEPRLAEPDVLAEPIGHADEIDALMDGWLAQRTRFHAVTAAQELRIPMTEVFRPDEVVTDVTGQHTARSAFADVQHARVTVRQPAAPVRMSETPWTTSRSPTLGEHNVEVYCDELGLSMRDLAVLATARVI